MIKKAVYAYWAKPFVEKDSYSNFQRRNDLRVSLKLSVFQARKFFDKVVFYGDHEAISQVCGVVDFDEVYEDLEVLNEMNVPSYFWSIAKAFVCERMEQPFVLLENDFYLWDVPSGSKFLESELIVEDMHETPVSYFDEIARMKEDDLKVRPRWYRFANRGKFKIPSKGIYGGTDVGFIQDHAREITRLVKNPENLKVFQLEESRRKYLNTHKIYDLWYCGAKFDMQKKEPLLMRGSDVKYTHLYSDKKNDPEVSIRMYERVCKDLPDFMKKIEETDGLVYDPVSDYDYFIEPTKGIENVCVGKKKLTFVMGLMNRKHQIEQT